MDDGYFPLSSNNFNPHHPLSACRKYTIVLVNMDNNLYFLAVPLLVLGIIAIGLWGVNSAVSLHRLNVSKDISLREKCRRELAFLHNSRATVLLFVLLIALFAAGAWYWQTNLRSQALTTARKNLWPVFDPAKIWTAPDPYLAATERQAELIAYGRDLVARTQDYFGAAGIVRPKSINGLNCQSCHLDAGSKPFGNNYFAVASTYPQMRARSASLESIPKRVNDCFQRSLNGQPIDTTSREMRAIVAYIQWLGTGVPKGAKPKGTGIWELPFMSRAADPALGEKIYAAKCASCHGADGQGLPMPDSPRQYPPLWGTESFNAGAGLFRLSRFAGYIKANMPFGATYDNPQLSDEEAWDVAAFVNAQPRPAHPFLQTDWPKIDKKPFDHPFGPYLDTFPAIQHKFGPFGPIVDFYKAQAKK